LIVKRRKYPSELQEQHCQVAVTDEDDTSFMNIPLSHLDTYGVFDISHCWFSLSSVSISVLITLKYCQTLNALVDEINQPFDVDLYHQEFLDLDLYSLPARTLKRKCTFV
jgi:hypothetical protein